MTQATPANWKELGVAGHEARRLSSAEPGPWAAAGPPGRAARVPRRQATWGAFFSPDSRQFVQCFWPWFLSCCFSCLRPRW